MKPKSPQYTWLNNTEVNNKKVYFILSMILYLSKQINPKCTFASKVQYLLEKYDNIDPRAMGFPDDWESEKLWCIKNI